MRYKKKKKNAVNPLLKAAIIALLLTVLAFILVSVISNFVLRPVLLTAGKARAQMLATLAISETVSEEMSENGWKYAEIITLQKDDDGSLKALTTDAVKVNTLKANMQRKVLKKLEGKLTKIEIPLGNFISGELFSGRGPRIGFDLVPVGTVNATFSTLFTDAGINQTRLQTMLCVSSTVEILMPISSIKSSVSSSICVAETVVVGKVPEYFTQINELMGDSKADLAANYGADQFANLK